MLRADLLLVELGFARSRTHAQQLIKSSRVRAEIKGKWQSLTKPGLKLESDTRFEVEEDEGDRYVSRGALKLLKALDTLQLVLTSKTAIDVGQSTGGFTDCLLQAGIDSVVGIEVGHDQLADKLRRDPRVTCYEGINGRDLPHEMLLEHTNGKGFDLAVMDVSFISQRKILPSLIPLIAEEGYLISLVKPQFEVGKEGIGRGGIVRDSSLYPQVKAKVAECCANLGMQILDYFESPIKGGDGNREFLIIAQKI
ncbi:TlyA family RNA methyltransferase [Neptuniibacter sp. PT8_73]|uniref:TlyA family RNA methyltransferase n=1 Tax=unclassified Neptuniibacter TaxID=2630693 RepID=UPI0039F5A653